MSEKKTISLRDFIIQHKKTSKCYENLTVAREIVHYCYKKRSYDKNYFMNYQKLCIILYVIFCSTRAAKGLPILGSGIPYIDKQGFINFSCKKMQNYYLKEYDVAKFYSDDEEPYNKNAIEKDDRKIIHKICNIFIDKGFVSCNKFINKYKLGHEHNHLAFSVPDKKGFKWWNDLFGTMPFNEFVKNYVVKVKAKKTGDAALNDEQKE